MKAKTAREILEATFTHGWQVAYIDKVVPLMEEYASQFREPSIAENSEFSSSKIGSHHWSATVLSYIMRVGEYLQKYGSNEGKNDTNYRGWGAGILDRAKEVHQYIISGSIAEQPGEQDRIKELEQEIERLNELVVDKTILLDAAKIGCNQRDERIKILEEALNDLMDVQNGPPLETYKEAWNEAMDNAWKALTTSQPKDVNTTE